MRKSWEWWRRGGGCPCLMKEAGVLKSQIREEARMASSEGWIDWRRRRQPHYLGIFPQRCPDRSSPIVCRFVVPGVLRFTTAVKADSRRQSSSSEKEDEDEDRESDVEFESEEWEEEDDSDPRLGDGGDGGGINLGNVAWGERALSLATEILGRHFEDDLKMFAFKISPKGYIYVRLDKLSSRYGCPEMEEIEEFSRVYDKYLEESGERGEIPKELGLEVSSPGAERLLKVPEDLERFREMPMLVHYLDENDDKNESKIGFYLLDAVDPESQFSMWKLADVKENRDLKSKGRPMNRQRRDWRLKLPFHLINKVMLYVP